MAVGFRRGSTIGGRFLWRAELAYGVARLLLRLLAGHPGWRLPSQSVAQRLAALPPRGLPVSAPVEIRWNAHLVPFVAADRDRDLAVALGLVHAHLRLAQMELLRRIAYGRVAEILGPVAVSLDHGMRVLDPVRAVPAIVAMLPGPTRDWLAGYVEGINHHLAAGVSPPIEFRLLGVTAEPWRIEDVVALIRLAAADVNWLLAARLLTGRDHPEWRDIWSSLLAAGSAPNPANSPDPLAGTMLSLARGSNAIAIGAARSAGGLPLLAGDPHLPLSLPSVWLQAAYCSPSYNVAGLMIPGIPAVIIGRNPALAWGGTNLHAASSDFFDVSDLPAHAFQTRAATLAVRWSRPRELILRESPYGPVVSDLPFLGRPGRPAVALRWVGHYPSDEITALLAMNRATDTASFRRAADGIAVPGQKLVFAERSGHIGRILAAWLPRRSPKPPADMLTTHEAAAAWDRFATAADLPSDLDPPDGFVVSANDRPSATEVPIGWFFSPPDRAHRLASLVATPATLAADDAAAVLLDLAMPAALAIRDRLLQEAAPSRGCPVREALALWDGRYAMDSSGALAFELVLGGIFAAAGPADRRALLGAAWDSRRLLLAEFDRLDPEDRAAILRRAFAAARPVLRRLSHWGAAHRLRLKHPLGWLPGLGRRFRFTDWPWPGGNDTVFKSAHAPVAGVHAAGYGSNARYIFDLSEPDANRLVILGGQDGVPGSAAFLDQAEMFRRGEYIDVPLRLQTARRRFRHVTMLGPE